MRVSIRTLLNFRDLLLEFGWPSRHLTRAIRRRCEQEARRLGYQDLGGEG